MGLNDCIKMATFHTLYFRYEYHSMGCACILHQMLNTQKSIVAWLYRCYTDEYHIMGCACILHQMLYTQTSIVAWLYGCYTDEYHSIGCTYILHRMSIVARLYRCYTDEYHRMVSPDGTQMLGCTVLIQYILCVVLPLTFPRVPIFSHAVQNS